MIGTVLVILLAQAGTAREDQSAPALFRAAVEAQQRGELERAVETTGAPSRSIQSSPRPMPILAPCLPVSVTTKRL